MKAKKKDKIIREFFTAKLEDTEIVPDPSVRTKLFRKLAAREFLRFNPVRINIWYLCGLLIAGVLLGTILTSQSGNKAEQIKTGTEADSSENTLNDSSAVSRDRPSVKGPTVKVDSEILVSKTTKDPESLKENKPIIPAKTPALPVIIQSVSSGCAPLKVSFKVSTSGHDSCFWSFGDGGYSFSNDPEWIFDVAGKYKVNLKVYQTGKPVQTYNSSITVHPAPSARFEFSPERPLIPGQEVSFINYSGGAVKYRWDFGDGSTSQLFEPKHSYQSAGDFNVILVAYSLQGCYDSLYVPNAFSGSAYYIDFPKTFAPVPGMPAGGYYSSQGNESGQVFHPVSSGVSDYQLRIFSKAGLLLFESHDIRIGWDGYYNGALCESGAYNWKVRGTYVNGEPFTKMGDVTLLKSAQ